MSNLTWPNLTLPPINLWNAPKMNKLIKLSTKMCGPCKQMEKVMADFNPYEHGIQYEAYDAHEFPLVTEKLGARAVPFFALLDGDGEVIKSKSGTMTMDELLIFIE